MEKKGRGLGEGKGKRRARKRNGGKQVGKAKAAGRDSCVQLFAYFCSVNTPSTWCLAHSMMLHQERHAHQQGSTEYHCCWKTWSSGHSMWRVYFKELNSCLSNICFASNMLQAPLWVRIEPPPPPHLHPRTSRWESVSGELSIPTVLWKTTSPRLTIFGHSVFIGVHTNVIVCLCLCGHAHGSFQCMTCMYEGSLASFSTSSLWKGREREARRL